MKIGIDIRTLMGKEYSGVEEYTYNLVKEILRLDKNNEYKLFYNSYSDVSHRIPKFEGANIEIINTRYPNKIFNYIMQKIFSWPKIDKVLGGVDIFWSPHINFTTLSKECYNVLTICDLSFLLYPDFFNLRKRLWHNIINVRNLISRFDKIIAISENTKNDIKELSGVDERKIKLIYPGISNKYKIIEINDIGLREVKKKYKLGDKFILFISTLEPRKNIVGIIKAYNKLRAEKNEFHEIKLIIAGKRGWKDKSIFKEWQKSKYKNDINFLGYIPNKDKVFLYNLASVFIYTSFYEGFGFPPLEAMACGTPVIASYSSSLSEALGKAALMVDPYNTKDISQAIKLIIGDHKLRGFLIESGLARAGKFTWEIAAKKYIDIFNKK